MLLLLLLLFIAKLEDKGWIEQNSKLCVFTGSGTHQKHWLIDWLIDWLVDWLIETVVYKTML